jgi:sortase A
MRGFLRDLGFVLVVAGCVFLLDAGLTVVWQDPFSALLARLNQDDLNGGLNRLQAGLLTPVQDRALRSERTAERRIRFLARAQHRGVRDGQAIGRIRIPRIDAGYAVVEGTNTADLRKGPGHYPSTTVPGLPGTVAIAGHRTTYLAPFRDVNKLKAGDPVVVDMPYARFTYAVQQVKIVSPDDVGVTRSVGYDRLVLTACHPLYSAAQRIVVFARLKRTEPKGLALRS